MGSDQAFFIHFHLPVIFQSTLPHGERPAVTGFVLIWAENFNPRSRMGSDENRQLSKSRIAEFQSTLPHGERLWLFVAAGGAGGFQSTLPHGERPEIESKALRSTNFNPRSRMGSDERRMVALLDDGKFQSTLPHGERLFLKNLGLTIWKFQSTLPHGERLADTLESIQADFDISIHAPAWGATILRLILLSGKWISIHAPAWGATCLTPV